MSDLIEKHLRRLTAWGWSEETIKDRRKLLRRLDGELPFGLEEATADELEDFLAGFTSNQTKATYYGHIVGFYTWACGDDGYLDFNPAASLRRPKVPAGVPNPVTDEELADLLERSEEPFRTWFILAAYAGLRPVEIAKLERRDVTEHTITVRGGKGGKNAAIPTHPLIWAIVKDRPSGRIARQKTGGLCDADYISARVCAYLHGLGIYGIGCRRLRHWYGTTALLNTPNLRVVQGLMRHSSPTTTAIYTQITDGQRRSAVVSLPVLVAPVSV